MKFTKETMVGLKQKECRVERQLAVFPNNMVASTVAHEKLLAHIPGKELKESLLEVIFCEGLTFGEQAFIYIVAENWYRKKYGTKEAKRD